MSENSPPKWGNFAFNYYKLLGYNLKKINTWSVVGIFRFPKFGRYLAFSDLKCLGGFQNWVISPKLLDTLVPGKPFPPSIM